MARILVVDDEPDVRELFNITLKMAGHATETAKDGLEALDFLTGDMPDLILLDLMMPRLDGFGLLTHIREKLAAKPVRVLVATAKVLEDADNQRLASWPVVGVLNKGELDISAMVIVISTALKKEPMKAIEAESSANGSPKDSEPSPSPSAPPSSGINTRKSPSLSGPPFSLRAPGTTMMPTDGDGGTPK